MEPGRQTRGPEALTSNCWEVILSRAAPRPSHQTLKMA